MTSIEARGLVKRYRATLAVDRLGFDVSPGTVTGFLGPNGAGKSATMRMIMGLDRPDAGLTRIGGKAYGDPGVLLLDEPANGLDPEGIRWTRNSRPGPRCWNGSPRR